MHRRTWVELGATRGSEHGLVLVRGELGATRADARFSSRPLFPAGSVHWGARLGASRRLPGAWGPVLGPPGGLELSRRLPGGLVLGPAGGCL